MLRRPRRMHIRRLLLEVLKDSILITDAILFVRNSRDKYAVTLFIVRYFAIAVGFNVMKRTVAVGHISRNEKLSRKRSTTNMTMTTTTMIMIIMVTDMENQRNARRSAKRQAFAKVTAADVAMAITMDTVTTMTITTTMTTVQPTADSYNLSKNDFLDSNYTVVLTIYWKVHKLYHVLMLKACNETNRVFISLN